MAVTITMLMRSILNLGLSSYLLRNEGADSRHQINIGEDALTSESCDRCTPCLPHSQVWSGRRVYSTEGLRRSESFLRLPLSSLRVLLPLSVICQGEAERTKVADPHMSLARTWSHSCIRVRGGGAMCCSVLRRKEQWHLADNWGAFANPQMPVGLVCVCVTYNS